MTTFDGDTSAGEAVDVEERAEGAEVAEAPETAAAEAPEESAEDVDPAVKLAAPKIMMHDVDLVAIGNSSVAYEKTVRPEGEVRIAEAGSDIDAAWRQLSGNLADEYALLLAGKEVPLELRARARRDQVRASQRAIAAVDRLFEAAGATALQTETALQRFWRDAHAGRVHAANDAERAYVMFGNQEFGLPLGDTMV